MANAVPIDDEVGGRQAQVLEPWDASLGSFRAFAATVRAAWSAETAWIDAWDPRNPARGQCGTSSLALQDEHGGTVVRGLVHDTGRCAAPAVHYWNVIDGRHVDLTWQQFSPSAFVLRSDVVGRDDLLVSRWFEDRYDTLRRRIDSGPAETPRRPSAPPGPPPRLHAAPPPPASSPHRATPAPRDRRAARAR